MEFYLKEAFQSLKLLEDDFNLTADQGVIDELQSFVADDIEAPAEEEIIDVEADEVEDLQDNYIGKVILECDSCHTRIYKNIADVLIDDESGLANIEEECPVCGSTFGWNVIGKIEKFDADAFKEEPEEEDVEEEELEISDDEISEALREALTLEDQAELDGIVYNHLADAAYEAEVDHELEVYRSDMEKAEAKFNDRFYQGSVEENLDEEFEDPSKLGLDDDTAVEDDVDLETPGENPTTEIPDKLVVDESLVAEDIEDVQSEDAEKLIDPEKEPVLGESLDEDLNDVEVHTDTQDIEVKEEDGKVVVEVGNQEAEEPQMEDEMIAPLSDKDEADIENDEATLDADTEEDEFDEFAIDDFDEESFDEIGESYLHRVYENVNSFKTTDAKYDNGKLVVEGLIKFNSGKEKATSFVFENMRTTKRGKVMAEGMNDTFSKSKRAFILKGNLDSKRFISESLTYNYTAKTINESNESEITKIYGRAIKK